MKPKIVGDRTSPDSVPTRDDKHCRNRNHDGAITNLFLKIFKLLME